MPSRSASLTVRRRTGWPSNSMAAFVGRIDAGEDFHERRFARAVLADDRQDFAGVDLQVEHPCSACTPGNAFEMPMAESKWDMRVVVNEFTIT